MTTPLDTSIAEILWIQSSEKGEYPPEGIGRLKIYNSREEGGQEKKQRNYCDKQEESKGGIEVEH